MKIKLFGMYVSEKKPYNKGCKTRYTLTGDVALATCFTPERAIEVSNDLDETFRAIGWKSKVVR